MPNLRKKARGRPQRQQRLRCRQRSFGFLFFRAVSSFRSLAILAVVAIVFLSTLLPERHSHLLQQRQPFGVGPGRRRY
jgi:hypothetical protein